MVTRLAIWASTLRAMSAHQVRAFAEGDTDACVALMRENTPEFFTSSELAAFEGWLGSNTSPYLVIEDADGRLLACGGYSVNVAERLAGLTCAWLTRLPARMCGREVDGEVRDERRSSRLMQSRACDPTRGSSGKA